MCVTCVFDGRVADVALPADLGVRVAARDEAEHVSLTLRQLDHPVTKDLTRQDLDRRAQGSATKPREPHGDQQRQPRKLLEMNETGRVV
jgi:hypothetical protein